MQPLILATPTVLLWPFLARGQLLLWVVTGVLVGWAVTMSVLFARSTTRS